MTKPKAKNQGFTLIEVLVATIIVVIISMIALVLFLNVTVLGRLSKEKLKATKICQNKIEELRRMSYAEIANLQSPLNTNTTLEPISIPELDEGQLLVQINNYQNPEDDIKEVIITLTWKGPKKNPQTATLTTLMAERGLND